MCFDERVSYWELATGKFVMIFVDSNAIPCIGGIVDGVGVGVGMGVVD
jgi:hypothetical protein